MADHSPEAPRVIALIDMLDLRRQLERSGGVLGDDLTAVLELLETGLAELEGALDTSPEELDRAPQARPSLGAVYLYSPLETDRPREAGRVVFRQTTQVNRECSGCYRACTHCRGGATDGSGQGLDNPIAGDLLELARQDAYDWAAIVSSDRLLIPMVRYLQSHGRKIIHGCFPPVARDLTKECWAFIDLTGASP